MGIGNTVFETGFGIYIGIVPAWTYFRILHGNFSRIEPGSEGGILPVVFTVCSDPVVIGKSFREGFNGILVGREHFDNKTVGDPAVQIAVRHIKRFKGDNLPGDEYLISAFVIESIDPV